MPPAEMVQPLQVPDETKEKNEQEKETARKTSEVETAALFTPEVNAQIPDKKIDELKQKYIKRKEDSQHRYLQTLIKKMAESRGYKATIEVTTPDGKGKADVLLEKGGKQIACEVSVTTDVIWEMHNIRKCLDAGYSQVLSCVSDKKNLPVFQKKTQEIFTESEQSKILVTTENIFNFLVPDCTDEKPTETVVKGYRVNVSYDALTDKESKKKQESVAKIIADSLQRSGHKKE